MSDQGWTPAPKLGIIPLHPLSFGTVLGRSFAILRHNPKVLFGFAIMVQLVVLLASAAVIFTTVFATFSRLDTVSPSSPDYDALLIGSMAWTLVVGFIVSVGSVAFTVIVQGVVAADTRAAVLGVKARLPQLWRQVKPAFWRLFGFAVLVGIVGFGLVMGIIGVVVALTAGLIAVDPDLAPLAVLFGFLAALLVLPVVIWLATKLMLVPAILVIEHATLRTAVVRSWRLLRRRFWFAFGIVAVISLILGAASQVIVLPASLISGMLAGIFAPTGDPDTGAIIGLIAAFVIPQILSLILQSIQMVVLCSATVLVYIDCRMRYEGLDHDLLTYVEKRGSGAGDELLGDPFAVDAGRAVGKEMPVAAAPVGPPHPYPPPGGYPPPVGYPVAPAPGAPAPPYGAPPPPYAAPPPPQNAPPAVMPPASDSPWTPPGARSQ